ncbi:hypothetical protein IAQ61_011158 [Plenodomus lingam]|uniref:Predicted protein n=1 Tax=Leptosphaeria maculans (strain JN3 / isolate v23.1.3 / race Av1-4-5-6-7-8) TaxID=985895 RepID=E5A986_LEPMJ|nr:predicted protein [Plenodomus lingam JN3]KAH9859377.1 hypothetical protein IAQ61_011158 [Plenodomus lingam]CBY00227.1 predicted protein [Plenodomus lingam JN3]
MAVMEATSISKVVFITQQSCPSITTRFLSLVPSQDRSRDDPPSPPPQPPPSPSGWSRLVSMDPLAPVEI